MSNFCLENQFFLNCLKKSKFFENLPEKIEIFLKFALKNRNFSKICLEKPKFVTNLPEKIEIFAQICLEKSKFQKNCLEKSNFCVKLPEKIEISLKFAPRNRNFVDQDQRPPDFKSD